METANPSNLRAEPKLWLPRTLAAVAWVIYIGYLLLSDFPPGASLLHTEPATLRLALDLSLNFGFVLPLLFPASAPELNPLLEALFNLVVAWGLLFWGFLLDGRGQRWPMLPFLIGTAFLTNVFYLPWLALRSPQTRPPNAPLNWLERLAEGRILPLGILAVILAVGAWAIWGHPGLSDWATRWQGLVALFGSDRLTYSFGVDLLVFWLFQGWLVPDDMARRQWQSAWALWVARLVPCFGLILYLGLRPALPPQGAPTASDQLP